MTAGCGGSDSGRRKHYRSLFLTYPKAWRKSHEDVVLDTLLDLHDARGIVGPTLLERARFTVDGLRRRLIASSKRRPTRHFASHASLAPIPTFDQTNGLIENTRPLSEREQVHVNAAAGANSDEQRIAPSAWFTLHAASRADHPRRQPGRRTERL